MKPISFRLPFRQIALHWGVVTVFLATAITVYLLVFVLPYQGLSLERCPTTCHYDTDCWVPNCTRKARCIRAQCQLAGGHKHFFSAMLIGLFGVLGLLWAGVALFKSRARLTIDDQGLRLIRLHREVFLAWEDFLGITYHGVNTRFGQEATVYSVTGDTGIFSFLTSGLPKGTSTRDLELGALFFFYLSPEDAQQLLQIIQEKTSATPEPEHEW